MRLDPEIERFGQEGQTGAKDADASEEEVEGEVDKDEKDDGGGGDGLECAFFELGGEGGPDEEEEEKGGDFGEAEGCGEPFDLAGEEVEDDLTDELREYVRWGRGRRERGLLRG
ncbi:hypothetical protein C369_07452 [Cryptococcus neoformans A5-35-17]|nr:hypothetical protein C369_07452 [Cryptococcus neoformans var. grubii A5-35-17]